MLKFKAPEDFVPFYHTHNSFNLLTLYGDSVVTLKAKGCNFIDCDLANNTSFSDQYKGELLDTEKVLVLESNNSLPFELHAINAKKINVTFSYKENDQQELQKLGSFESPPFSNMVTFEEVYPHSSYIALIDIFYEARLNRVKCFTLKLLCVNISTEAFKKSQICKSVKLAEISEIYSTIESNRQSIVGDNKKKLSFYATSYKLDFSSEVGMKLPKNFLVKIFGNKLNRSLKLEVKGVKQFEYYDGPNKDNYLNFHISIPDTYKENTITIIPIDNDNTNYYQLGPFDLIESPQLTAPVEGKSLKRQSHSPSEQAESKLQGRETLGKHVREDCSNIFQSEEKKRKESIGSSNQNSDLLASKQVDGSSSSNLSKSLQEPTITPIKEVPASVLVQILNFSEKFNLSQTRMYLCMRCLEMAELELLVNFKQHETNTTAFLIGLYMNSQVGRQLVERALSFFTQETNGGNNTTIFVLNVKDWLFNLWSDILIEVKNESFNNKLLNYFNLRIREEVVQYYVKKGEYGVAMTIMKHFTRNHEAILNELRIKRTNQ